MLPGSYHIRTFKRIKLTVFQTFVQHLLCSVGEAGVGLVGGSTKCEGGCESRWTVANAAVKKVIIAGQIAKKIHFIRLFLGVGCRGTELMIVSITP